MNNTSQQPAQDVSLVILAAGLGSRFGGDKQLAVLGPDQRPLMHYNVMDAYAAGVRHAVLILREELVAIVERDFLPYLPRDMEIDLAIQAVDDLPAGCALQQRKKPWGTGHALWCARDKLSGPFITVNADDYYGAGAIHALAAHFQQSRDWALVCYTLESTLTPNGGVNRGLCALRDGYLETIEECLQIQRETGTLRGVVDETWRRLDAEVPVSMSLWGFTPALFALLEQEFRQFLDNHGSDPQAEFLLPDQVLAAIERGCARVRAYHSDGQWLGITYPEDVELVNTALAARDRR